MRYTATSFFSAMISDRFTRKTADSSNVFVIDGQRNLNKGQIELNDGQRNLNEGQKHLYEYQIKLTEGLIELIRGQRNTI